MSWMIYGANGYTGELAAREAVRKGLSPILAGRNAEAVGKLANELGLQSRAFTLGDAQGTAAELYGVKAVLHCAGPFLHTSAPMVAACLATGAHYLDITGEIPVFERVLAQGEAARQAGGAPLPRGGLGRESPCSPASASTWCRATVWRPGWPAPSPARPSSFSPFTLRKGASAAAP